jgi:hypothetical protein
LEGAIAAVFEHLKNEIALEIDTPEFGTSWRKLVGGVDTRPFLRYH